MPDVTRQTRTASGTANKLKAIIPVGRYRLLFLASILIALGLTVIYDSIPIQTITFGIGLAWIIFENWITFKAVVGVQSMLIFMSQPKTGDKQRKEGASDEKS